LCVYDRVTARERGTPADSPGDPAGPAKAEWNRYLGIYHARAYGEDVESPLTLTNGYL
jgi:hypothetical protein